LKASARYPSNFISYPIPDRKLFYWESFHRFDERETFPALLHLAIDGILYFFKPQAYRDKYAELMKKWEAGMVPEISLG